MKKRRGGRKRVIHKDGDSDKKNRIKRREINEERD